MAAQRGFLYESPGSDLGSPKEEQRARLSEPGGLPDRVWEGSGSTSRPYWVLPRPSLRARVSNRWYILVEPILYIIEDYYYVLIQAYIHIATSRYKYIYTTYIYIII